MPAIDANINIINYWNSESKPRFYSYAKSNDENEDSIFKLLKLKQGWHFGEGDEIDRDTIIEAIKIYKKVKDYSLNLEVHPLLNGGVNLLFYKDDNFLDVFINRDKTISLKQEKGIGYDFETIYEKDNASEIDLFERLNSISSTKFLECISLEHFMSENTVKQKEDFKAIRSQIMEAEYPFLTFNVQSTQHPQEFALIFQSSTAEPLVFQ